MDYMRCLNSFISVCESGSFTAAADKLDLTPAMIGKHIQMLEKRTGCTLIKRTTRRQGLTEAGRRFYQHALQVIDAVEQADAIARYIHETVTGMIRISAPVAFGHHVLVPILADFLKRHPGVDADLVLSDTRADLIQERFQIAVRIGSLEDRGYIALPLPPYAMLLAASPAYLNEKGLPTLPQDLVHHDCISFSQWRSDHLWQFNGPQGHVAVEINPRLTVDSGEALRRAALSGLGIVMQSRLTLSEDIEKGRLVRVLPDYVPDERPVSLLRLPGQPDGVLVPSFVDYFMQALPAFYP